MLLRIDLDTWHPSLPGFQTQQVPAGASLQPRNVQSIDLGQVDGNLSLGENTACLAYTPQTVPKNTLSHVTGLCQEKLPWWFP